MLPVVAVPELVAVELAVPVVTEVPLAVVLVADAPEAVLVQLTADGTVTPWAEQIWEAKVMAEAWSAWSQSPTRQQATLERKSWLEQMHFASVPQPAYEPPVNCSEAQFCWRKKKKGHNVSYRK